MSDTTPTNVNPPADGGSLSTRHLVPCLEPLLRQDEKGNVTGHLAESFDVSPDGKTITFHIRKGVKFHDGTPLNAEAVKYNLEATAASGLWGVGILNVAKSYDIIDEYTLRANLEGFNYNYLTALCALAGLIASPTALQTPASEEDLPKLHMVGTGPFIFESFKRDDRVTFVKNPDYWQEGKPYLDGIVLRNIADRTVALMAFQAGEADEWATGLQLATSNMLEEQGYNITPYPLRFHFAMTFDSSDPNSPFADKRVREALHYGVDKQTLVNGIGGGAKRGFAALHQMAEPGDPWYCPELPPREYDLAKAKDLLAQAGYPDGFKTTLVSDTFAEMNFMEALLTELKKMGIDATLDVADLPRITQLEMGGWEGLLHPGFPTSDTIPGLNSRWGDPAFFVSMYKPAEWNDMWAAVMAEINDTKRVELMKDIVRLDYNEAVTFTWRGDAPFGVNDGTSHDFVLHAGGAMDIWWPEAVWKEKK
jgi:peptide/nickel transport system substrate-binding protein